MTDIASCIRCGAELPANSRFCNVCGASVSGEHGATVSAAVAREDRLSDSGAIELKNLLIAETANDYEIHEELGRGGMAVVYRAREIALERTVAIKILPPELTFAKGATERFRREAKTAAALDHPNIIPIYRISSGGRLFWYAMKYLEGRSLGDLLQEKGLLTVSEAIHILGQVAEALDYAHAHGVVHRDVKPGNVMIDGRGRVIVTDFGIAKELQGGALTGSGAILGTPYYMSPEQCRGTALTGAADQYSLGVMAYQMITGQLPFEADSAIDVIHKHVSEPPPPIEQYLPSLPRHVTNAINRAMAKKPEDRFPTVTSFVAAMRNEPSEATLIMQRRASLAGAAAPAAGRRSGIDKPPTLRGTIRRVAIGVPVVGALVAGSVWLATRSQQPEPEQRSIAIEPAPQNT
ncbi:MAG TPA: serine/threonine-protein kinase, partial [Gemmatimonadales bacterium]|nr:serine/threonine-protein kinase [Gemmatimonadales bacterium]